MKAKNDKNSHLTKGWYTQEEAWTELGIGKTTYHKLKKKGKIKTHIAEGIRIQRVSREDLIRLKETLFKKPAVPAQEPTHLKEKREEKRRGKAKKGDPPPDKAA